MQRGNCDAWAIIAREGGGWCGTFFIFISISTGSAFSTFGFLLGVGLACILRVRACKMSAFLPLLLALPLSFATPAPQPMLWPFPINNLVFARDDANNNVSTSTACAAVHIIVARASQEPSGQGSIGTLATRVATNIPGTSVEWVDYPAVLIPYDSSSYKGAEAAIAAVTAYTDKCPGKIVLMGYSQGAQVVGDVMCGGGGALGLGPWTDPVKGKYSDRVVAVVQMGDPRHMIDKTWDAGTDTTEDGVGFLLL